MFKRLTLTSLACVLLPLTAAAAVPRAYLERAEVIATGKQVQAFRVPTKDANGRLKYYDVTINLSVLADGKIDPANVTLSSVATPAVLTNGFVSGTYLDNLGNTCTLTTSAANGGRLEVALSCLDPNGGSILTAAWTTGLIPGHPLERDLAYAGIDAIPGYSNYSWGMVGSTYGTIWGCFYRGYVISARQVGSQLSLSSYGNDDYADCGITLTKQ